MNVVLIGLGNIARYHIAALAATPRYVLCGVCDSRPEAASARLAGHVPFYRDYVQMLDSLRPDIAVIATPPSSHYAIATACVQRGVTPFVEKPLAANGAEAKRFFEAPLQGRFVPMYHTVYGEELIWLEKHCPLRRIKSIRMELSDPYADTNGQIEAQYVRLGGSWLDSAPNALAPLFRLLPETPIEDIRLTHQTDSLSGLPYHTEFQARAGQTRIAIEVDWHKGINRKRTFIEADGHHYLLHHSEQSVTRDGELLFAYKGQDRLTRQYTNLYQLYPARVPSEAVVQAMSEIIYKTI